MFLGLFDLDSNNVTTRSTRKTHFDHGEQFESTLVFRNKISVGS